MSTIIVNANGVQLTAQGARVAVGETGAVTAPAQIYFPSPVIASITPNTPSTGIYQFNNGLGTTTNINTNASALPASGVGGTVQSVLNDLLARVSDIENVIGVAISGTALVTMPHATWVTLGFSTSQEWLAGTVTHGNSTITLPSTGKWRIDTSISIANSPAAGFIQTQTNRNAQNGFFGYSRLSSASAPFQDTYSVSRPASAADVVAVRVRQETGATIAPAITLYLSIWKESD